MKNGLLTPGKTQKEMKEDPFYKDFFEEYEKHLQKDKLEQVQEYPSNKIIQKYQMESEFDLKKRLTNFINFINTYRSKKILVVSHNGTITELNKILLNTFDTIKGDMSKGKNCHLTYYKNNNKKWKLVCAPTTFFL